MAKKSKESERAAADAVIDDRKDAKVQDERAAADTVIGKWKKVQDEIFSNNAVDETNFRFPALSLEMVRFLESMKPGFREKVPGFRKMTLQQILDA